MLSFFGGEGGMKEFFPYDGDFSCLILLDPIGG